MRVRLIKQQSIERFASDHARSRSSFKIWLSILTWAEWNAPTDITASFSSADLLGNGSDRVVFNIAGNSYRMICKYHFGVSRVHLYIKWIGTHAEYTKLCTAGKQYTVSSY